MAYDPGTRTLYTGSAGNLYATSRSVQRRREGGAWECLNLDGPIKPGQKDGGREAICVRVEPGTGDLWVATSCYGNWRWIER